MMDEQAAIVGIMREIGIYDFVTKQAGSEQAAIDLFKNDFNELMRMCAEGV